MSEILFQYHKVHPTTWVYLSSLLTIGLYFKFSRLWSVRNLDLIGLILMAPGLLLVGQGKHLDVGYIWLFVLGGIFLFRLLLDPMMVRRPLLEPNLSVGGMTFIGVALLIFLMANVVNSKPRLDDVAGKPGLVSRGAAAASDLPPEAKDRPVEQAQIAPAPPP